MPASTTSLFKIMDETNDWLAIDKPGDLVCHPTKQDAMSSLIGRLRLYFADQPTVRPSFVNRLDRETTGVVLVAKSPPVHARFQRLLQSGSTEKIYLALVHGIPVDPEGTIDRPLGRDDDSEIRIRQTVRPDGQPSVTRWKFLHSSHQSVGRVTSRGEGPTGGPFSLLEVRPQTGRLHQIRVHLASIGLPVVGDKLYGPDPRLYLQFVQNGWSAELEKILLTPRQMLHAAELRMADLASGQTWRWQAPLPEDMRGFAEQVDMLVFLPKPLSEGLLSFRRRAIISAKSSSSSKRNESIQSSMNPACSMANLPSSKAKRKPDREEPFSSAMDGP
jgi:23S rRNA pseudouridine1911/1915/1917 synthase